MLHETITRVRAERRRDNRRRRIAGLVAAALLAVGALAGGLALGQPEVTDPIWTAVSADGVHLSTRLRPAAGWTRLDVEVAGVSWGERCRLVVTDTAGVEHEAGSWAASEKATRFKGAVLVPLNEVRSIGVVGHGGREIVRTERN